MRDVHASFETGAATDVGRVRKINEDSHVVRPERGMWCVADGMGGHDGGQLASSIVADALARVPAGRNVADLIGECAALIGEANRRIYAIAEAQEATIGTTVAILVAHGREFACVWAGDSRVYQIRDGRIRQVTRDHTEAQDLIDQGVLSVEEAARWPRRNVITRAIGVEPEAELEVRRGDLAPQDLFVLCSDGLTGHVGDDEILRAVLSQPPALAAQALVALTLTRGARDNVTVVIVRSARKSPTVPAPAPEAQARDAPTTWAREKTLPPGAVPAAQATRERTLPPHMPPHLPPHMPPHLPPNLPPNLPPAPPPAPPAPDAQTPSAQTPPAQTPSAQTPAARTLEAPAAEVYASSAPAAGKRAAPGAPSDDGVWS